MFMEQHIQPAQFDEKIFQLVGKDWMLITAGTKEKLNTMTASYGSFGILFGKPCAQIYVRPERYTFEFLEKAPYFSLSFFNERYRKQLQLCGKESGRTTDKVKECSFTVETTSNQVPYFKEARLTVICRKIYCQNLDASLLNDEKIRQAVYGTGGVHRMYVGEIVDLFYQQ